MKVFSGALVLSNRRTLGWSRERLCERVRQVNPLLPRLTPHLLASIEQEKRSKRGDILTIVEVDLAAALAEAMGLPLEELFVAIPHDRAMLLVTRALSCGGGRRRRLRLENPWDDPTTEVPK